LIIAISIVIMILINNIALSSLIIGELVGFIIFLSIFEILFRKWQNSLMR